MHAREMAGYRPQRRLAAILAADVAGYTRLMAADETGTLAALRAIWTTQFDPAVAAHGGRVVKRMGDGALAEFASAVDAVEAAVSIQQALETRNGGLAGGARIDFRIGVNLGDIVIEGGDIFGDGVNVAARLEGQAPPGGLLVSDAVHAQVRGKVGIAFEDAGALKLKNVEAPIRAWRWQGGEAAPARALGRPAEREGTPSIAVLPFANMSGDPEQEFFADGLVEDIIATLSKLSGLRVIARNSTFVYKGKAVDVRAVARELDVRYVLEGSVRKGGSRIRITAQLIEAASGAHVWAERYDRALDDIFAVQDEITLVLATEMQVRLTEGEQARLRYTTTTNVEAWTHWVEGLAHYRKAVTRENAAAILACWKKALALDPESASLNALIGLKHSSDARFGWWQSREDALATAHRYADRALELDPENADANVTASFLALMEGEHDRSVALIRKALATAPGSADVATFACFMLAFAGHPAEAVPHGERAPELSPNYPPYYLGILGNAYRLAGREDEAIRCFEDSHARAPGFGLVDLVLIHQRAGRADEAKLRAADLLKIRRDFTVAGWARTQFGADAAGLEADLAALRAAGLPAG